MPELPEVQTVVDTLLQEGIVGSRIAKATIRWPKTISGASPSWFRRSIQGQTIVSIHRRGKFIVIGLDSSRSLLIHLRMTGRLVVDEATTPLSRHVHVALLLDNTSRLLFHDTRKFGRMYLTGNPDEILGKLGPEPLSPEFTARCLGQALQSRRRIIKPVLLDQTIIAGLGNIYADEALWTSGIHPLRISSSLSETEIKALHRSIRKVLRNGIRNNGTSLGTGKTNFVSASQQHGRNQLRLNVFRRTGLPCPRCQTPIIRLVVGQRSTHVCEVCQQNSALPDPVDKDR